MRNPMSQRRVWNAAGLLGAVGLIALLAGCGGTGGASLAAPAQSYSQNSASGAPGSSAGAPASSDSSGSSSSSTSSQPPSPQYLIKSLNVDMTSPDPRKTAADLQSWVLTTDPKAQSAGTTYTQDGSSYDVSLTFNVEAALYPQIESYLVSYAQWHGGKLVDLQEKVLNVTNDYVDSQSRLANLRKEQQRLQTLMGQAQSLNDVLTIEQRLTDVEGQIEDIEAHLALLNGQTAFYTVQIQLTPLDSTVTPQPQPWNPGEIFQQAWGAAIVFGQGLLTILIWLGVFGIYILPVCALIWFGRRLVIRRRAARAASPAPRTP